MSMEELPVAHPVRTTERPGLDVVELDHLIHGLEESSAPGASPLLPFEQGGLARRQFGVPAQSARPVEWIAIVEAPASFDLRVSTDHGAGVERQDRSTGWPEDPMLNPVVAVRVLLHDPVPVVVSHPAVRFCWVASLCPALQFLVDQMVQS